MSERPMKAIVDVDGTRYVPYTDEEVQQRELDMANYAAQQAAREAEEQAKADAKLAGMAKLQELGLTGEQIAAMFSL